MIYLSQLLGNPVIDAHGEKVGTVSDLGIATGEVFPRITSLAFMGPGKTPIMISWRKYVESYDEHELKLQVSSTDLRFSYLQPDEVLLARDILNKQIVDTHGMRVVRVNDLKLSDTSSTQLRLLGAEVGIRGILRTLHPALETIAEKTWSFMGHPIPERIIAWSYMDLVERDLSNVKLSVSHKTLDELHPADIADIIERLDPRLRGQVFAQLDDEQRADALAEFDDDAMAAELMGGLNESDASRMLSEMDPDDAAELVSELDYDKAEKLLRLMGVNEQKAVRQLLGYKEGTAGRIMTSEFAACRPSETVEDACTMLKNLDEDFETVRYVYLTDEQGKLSGVVTLNSIIISDPHTVLETISTDELVCATPEDDQEAVAEDIAKYNLLAIPVVDADKRMLGIVTVDDALDVLEEEHAQDLQIVGGHSSDGDSAEHGGSFGWLIRRNVWFFLWILGSACIAGLAQLSGKGLEALFASAALPIALVLADDSINYVTSSFLNQGSDTEKTPLLAFIFKSLMLGIAFSAITALLSIMLNRILESLLGDQELLSALIMGFVGAEVAVFFSFMLAPVYFLVLKKRDERNQETSGFIMAVIAMCIALVLFALTTTLLTRVWPVALG